jgi:hypothetical protein
MAYPSVTYGFTNGTTISATEVNQNFTDLINGASDGTKDYNINALSVAGAANLNGNVALGNATSDDVTVTGRIASAVVPKTDDTYDLGTSALAWKDGYFDGAVITDTISELTAAAGVTIDGLTIKDSEVQNNGFPDSPKGYTSVTSTGAFNVTKTGSSLYNVVVNAAGGSVTANLPNDVKAGYRVRFEVTLTNSTEANSFFTSPAIAEAQINGTGFVELMALVDNPSVAGNWKVTDVEENCPAASNGSTANCTFSGGASVAWSGADIARRNKYITYHMLSSVRTAAANNSGTLSLPTIPERFRTRSTYIKASRVIVANLVAAGPGLMIFGTNGAVTVYRDYSATSWTASSTGNGNGIETAATAVFLRT